MCACLPNRRFRDGPVGRMQSESNCFSTPHRRLRWVQTMRIGLPNRFPKRTSLSRFRKRLEAWDWLISLSHHRTFPSAKVLMALAPLNNEFLKAKRKMVFAALRFNRDERCESRARMYHPENEKN